MLAVKQDLAKVVLIAPVCTGEGEKLALSRRKTIRYYYITSDLIHTYAGIDKHWRLIGWGKIMRGKKISSDSSSSDKK